MPVLERARRHGFVLLLGMLGLAILLSRLHGIELHSLTVDEATIAGFARGVLARGYPYLMVGQMEVPLATYELVPYLIAASVKLFGYSDLALRLPAVLFSTLTGLLLVLLGRRWFSPSVGLLAGLLYLLSPWAMYWGQNCFHPAQTQFFSLLAVYGFYRLLMSDQIALPLALWSPLTFALAYLSWEGTGLILPVMCLLALILRWGQWRWFFQVNLWIAGLLVLSVVVAQGVRRMLLQEPYIMVGFGKSDLAAPSLTFTQAGYEPWYYLQNFFFTESHLALSLFFMVGLVLMFFDRRLSFVTLFVALAYLCLTNLLGYYNAHYFYFVLPVYLLAVAAAFTRLLQLLWQAMHVDQPPLRQAQSLLVCGALAALLLIPSSTDVLKLYRLTADSIQRQRYDYRPGLAGIDSKGLSRVLASEIRSGDVLISALPLVSAHYNGNDGDYFIQTITDRKVVYDTVQKLPYYVDKFAGNPVLRSVQEIQDVLLRHQRVWFLAAPLDGMSKVIDSDALAFINQNMRVVAESYDSRLYLWEKRLAAQPLGTDPAMVSKR